MKTAFVTGSTGLLGNNLVRALVDQGWSVRALARSAEKAARQFGDLDRVHVVEGDLQRIDDFAPALKGVDVLFHAAAYFRDSYTGGDHRAALNRVNVAATRALMETAYAQGLPRIVHISSVATIWGPPGRAVTADMWRPLDRADAYQASKIQSDRAVLDVMNAHRDMTVSFVLPGWMFGPGDLGPTSAARSIIDFVERRIPGVVPGVFNIVDARDVAAVAIAAAERGAAGSRYIAAGEPVTMAELLQRLERITGVPAPRRRLSPQLLHAVALVSELNARLTKTPALLSWASVRLLTAERHGSRFDVSLTIDELGVRFRPLDDTLRDTLAWLRGQGMISAEPRVGAARVAS